MVLSSISVSDANYLSYAAQEASKSKLLSQHGCVAVVNGRIMARGHNSLRTQSNDGFISNTCSCHAEMDTLRKLYHTCCSNTYGKYGKQIKVARER